MRAAIGEQFDVGEVAEEVDTIGGYLVTKAGHVPVRGELVPGPGPFETEVLDADPRRVKRVRIYLRKDRRPGAGRDASALPRSAGGPPGTAARRTHPAEPEHAAHAVKFKPLINSIVLAWGWRRWAIAFVAGALSALAMAPFNAWPILFLTFPTLVWLIDGAGVGRLGGVAAAAATGWWFGFGYFVAGLYWMGYAFLVDAPTFGWLMPFAVIGLPAVLGIYTAIGVALARMLWTRGATRILALAASLTITEWLRGHLFTGFPWNTFGYALTAPLPLAQIASVIGIWGLTFITILVCCDAGDAHRRSRATPAATGCRWRSASRCSWRLAATARCAFVARRRGSSTACICASCSRTCSRMSASTIRPRPEVMKRYIDLSSRASARSRRACAT